MAKEKCRYHDITHGACQERCLSCGKLYVDRKKEKLHKYMDKRRKKK